MTLVPAALQAEIHDELAKIYGLPAVDTMYTRIQEIAAEVLERRPQDLREDDFNRSSDWYKQEVIYMFYPDQFGVSTYEQATTFWDLIGMLDYLRDLGATTLYLLPFMDSPMRDSGFDVRDPRSVRADLGGLEAFSEFSQQARAKGFKIKADLILNHFSDEHPWFQAALNGDQKMLDRFLYRKTPPKSRKYEDPQRGVMLDYQEDSGAISSRRLIFPEISPDHYRHVQIQGEDYYLYHTFYPFQLDVNWENPEVLYYVLEVIGHWANLGIDIFRMDAIPYFIKEPGTDAENLPRTHQLVKLLSAFLQTVAPRSVIQAEACQWPKDIRPYFGNDRVIDWNGRSLVRTDEVQIAYHFPYMPAMWASLVTGEKQHFWKAFYETPEIPASAAWADFLRVHDELTLEMVDLNTRKILYERLVPKGAEFRKGLGVSGRLSDFLDHKPAHIGQAFAIMLSLQGIPTLYYGDEIGTTNNWEYARVSEKRRATNQKGDSDVLSFYDSRDINRGPIPKEKFYMALEAKSPEHPLYARIRHLIETRKMQEALMRGEIQEVPCEETDILAYLRSLQEQRILVLHNLSAEGRIAHLTECPKELLNAKDLISEKQISIKLQGNDGYIPLEPWQSVWLRY